MPVVLMPAVPVTSFVLLNPPVLLFSSPPVLLFSSLRVLLQFFSSLLFAFKVQMLLASDGDQLFFCFCVVFVFILDCFLSAFFVFSQAIFIFSKGNSS
jgi:hypothetical protein